MRFAVKQGSAAEEPCDVLIVNIFQEAKELGGATEAVDRALGGLIRETIAAQEFEGSLGDTLIVPTCNTIPAKKILVVGLGKFSDLGILQVMRASGSAARKCRKMRAKRVASVLHGAGAGNLTALESGKAVTLGAILGTYEFIRLKTEKVKENSIESFNIVELSADKLDDVEKGIRRAEVIGDAVAFARDLGNEPSNVVTPEYLASVARTIAQESGHGLPRAGSQGYRRRRNGAAGRCRPRDPGRAEVHRDRIRVCRGHQDRRPRGQGNYIRLRRLLSQADGEHVRDEGRYVRRGGCAGSDARGGQAQA